MGKRATEIDGGISVMIFAILVTLWLVVLTIALIREQNKTRVVRDDLVKLTNYLKERTEP